MRLFCRLSSTGVHSADGSLLLFCRRARAKSTKVAASFSGLMMALIQFIDERLAGLAENQDEDEDERGDNGRKKNPGV